MRKKCLRKLSALWGIMNFDVAGASYKTLWGNNVFVSLPTGSRKLLCYSLLLGVFDEMCCSQELLIVIVVNPLVALMKDQGRAITARNVQLVFVGDADDEEKVWGQVSVSPESLLTDPMLARYAPEPYLPRYFGGTSCRWGSLCQEMVSDLKLLITVHFTAIHINVLFEEHLLFLTLRGGENF